MNSGTPNHPVPDQRRHVRRWILLGVPFLIVLSAFSLWWPRGGRDAIMLLLGPKFRVTETGEGTVSFDGEYEGFVVRCLQVCGDFKVGHAYGLLYRQEYLEYRAGGKKYALPVIEYRFHPNMVQGGRG
jgi:hypothetical protein